MCATLIHTKNAGVRLLVEFAEGTEARIRTQQRTPDGYEDVDAEVVPLVSLQEVLTEWYDIAPDQLQKIRTH